MIENFKKLIKDSPVATEKFINHCIGVYEILKTEGNSDEVCNAGLYHSIYGTSHINVISQDINNDRKIIQKEIGKYAENLVYEICSLSDRDNSILDGKVKYQFQMLTDIAKICRANLVELYINDNENVHPSIETCIFRYNILCDYLNRKINPFSNRNPIRDDFKILDNMFPYDYLCNLYGYVEQSLYKPNRSSNPLEKNRFKTTRFSCHLSKENFFQMGLLEYMQKISQILKQDLFIKEYYIGHYDRSTCSESHCDSHYPENFTILIYPNIYWEDIWAGDLKIYPNHNSELNYNKTIDFIPGRVVIIDSRIKHKVMPVSSIAESSRYSIAIKGCFYKGLNSLNDSIVDLDNIIHIKYE